MEASGHVVTDSESVMGAPASLPAAQARALENHLGGADAANYRRYEYDLIAAHCGRRVLEVGAGLGEFSAQFTSLEHLTVADTDPLCLSALRQRFAGRLDVAVVPMDLDGALELAEPVDTVLAMNVLEHIEDDVAALRGLAGLLARGGNVVLWVSAYPALYGDFDRLVGQHRRYTPAMVRAVARAAELTVDVVRPVNLLGGLAWWAAVRLARQGNASPRLVRIYDRTVVPTTRWLEQRWTPPFGQSLLCVLRPR